MEKSIWRTLNNVFDSATRNSIRKMNSLAGDHYLKLIANGSDPIIAVIKNTFKPKWDLFDTKYTAYKAAISDAQGTAQQLQNLWKEASSDKFDEWDTAVKNVYKKNSDEHKALFPNGHEPFRTGRYKERRTNVKAFHLLLSNDLDLADAATLVNTFLTEYDAVDAANTAKHQLIKTLSAEVKQLRYELAEAMFSNLGYLNWKFPDKPLYVESFFDIKLIIRSTPKSEGGESEELTLSVPANKTVEGGFTFADDTRIRVYNSGICNLTLFTKKDKSDSGIPADAYVLHPEDEEEIVMSSLGEDGSRYFFIANPSEEDGEIVVDLVV